MSVYTLEYIYIFFSGKNRKKNFSLFYLNFITVNTLSFCFDVTMDYWAVDFGAYLGFLCIFLQENKIKHWSLKQKRPQGGMQLEIT